MLKLHSVPFDSLAGLPVAGFLDEHLFVPGFYMALASPSC
jgi:hypothetical protein